MSTFFKSYQFLIVKKITRWTWLLRTKLFFLIITPFIMFQTKETILYMILTYKSIRPLHFIKLLFTFWATSRHFIWSFLHSIKGFKTHSNFFLKIRKLLFRNPILFFILAMNFKIFNHMLEIFNAFLNIICSMWFLILNFFFQISYKAAKFI